MTIVYACIAPHGTDIIPRLATRTTIRSFEVTRKGIRTLAREVKRARPDTIIIASPHNLRVFRKIAIVTAENSSGTLRGWNRPDRSVSMSIKCDVESAKELLQDAASNRLPVVGVNYGTFEGEHSDMAMDWGTLVPLWFFIRENRIKPKVLIVTPSREIPLKQNVAFGRVIARLCQRKPRRFVFVASADHAHAHRKHGPYGFHAAAAKYDRFVVEAIERNDLNRVMSLDRNLVEYAKPDSMWQMAILSGVLQQVKLEARLYSYQVPAYYGMVCAGFWPKSS
jgi:aromatic ring-opening dioxygenase LigB subunit